MGIPLLIKSLLFAGSAAAVEEQRKAESKVESRQREVKTTLEKKNKDKRVVTAKDKTKRNARAALVVGSPRGVLSNEDESATSGRGTLLGNP